MELIKWNKLKQAIVEAKTFDEVKDIRDKAQAMKAYAKQIGESQEAQNDIAEIKIRAERRAGDMLAETEKNPGGRPEKTGNTMLPVSPKLSDIGISKMQSSRWQSMASLPEEIFEIHITKTKEGGKELTSAGILTKATKEKKKNKTDEIRRKEVPTKKAMAAESNQVADFVILHLERIRQDDPYGEAALLRVIKWIEQRIAKRREK